MVDINCGICDWDARDTIQHGKDPTFPTLQSQGPEAMIEIGKVNPQCLDCEDIVNLDVVLRNVK